MTQQHQSVEELRGIVRLESPAWRIVAVLAGIKPSQVGEMEAKYRASYAPRVLHFTWLKQVPLHREASA